MELLVEIFCEEIPARMHTQAEKDFHNLWQKTLDDNKFNYSDLKIFVGSRRLTLVVKNLEEFSENMIEERRGPKVGAPDAAIQGFLKSTGFSVEELLQQNGYWIANINKPGRSIADALPAMLEQILRSMPWPTSMRWPGAECTWVRPIRNICCVYNKKSLEFYVNAAGLTTNNFTFGHRFLDPKTITVSTFENYLIELEAAKVVVDSEKRKNMIVQQLQTICTAKNLKFLPDENLLQEVTGLVEYPFVGLGNIEQKFMVLPNAVLSTSMRVHQKYFSILNSNETYAPYFAFVANVPINNEYMLPGYEKVLRARLSDALFFFEQDLKINFSERSDTLANVVFHVKLGSVLDKIHRLEYCAQDDLTKKAAALCKSDLLTLMVGEFPELQGIMGEIYASGQGVEQSVAKALSSYYKPHGADDDCPADDIGWQLSLIDKIDNLVGFFGVGIKPSGSKDPYGLRRSALGIIRLMISKKIPCDLNIWLERSVASYQVQGVVLSENTLEIVINFITERLSSYLKNDMPADHIYAVLDQPLNDIWVTFEKAKALKKLLQTEAGKTLQAAYTRVVGVLKQQAAGDVNQSLFTEDAEKNLYAMLEEINPKINQALAQFNFIEAMEELAKIKPAIDNFFDNVKVMDENLDVQKNRLHLLHLLQKTMYSFANFSKLEG